MMWTTSAATYLCTKPSAWTAPASWWLTTMPPASPRSWSSRMARRTSFSTTASCVMCPAGQQRAAVHRVWFVFFHYRSVEAWESIEDVEIMWLMRISVTRKRFHVIDNWRAFAYVVYSLTLFFFLYSLVCQTSIILHLLTKTDLHLFSNAVWSWSSEARTPCQT